MVNLSHIHVSKFSWNKYWKIPHGIPHETRLIVNLCNKFGKYYIYIFKSVSWKEENWIWGWKHFHFYFLVLYKKLRRLSWGRWEEMLLEKVAPPDQRSIQHFLSYITGSISDIALWNGNAYLYWPCLSQQYCRNAISIVIYCNAQIDLASNSMVLPVAVAHD